ncbi:MAG TPA: PhzF family phenazine biosynthesis protein [Gemmatimonadales bacterium]|nr:PhzF family phenazine biosynthesis protein [Gemmatimonadales bacterium]
MGLRVLQVDAFTDRAFAGNPAAVCLLERPADTGWMQNVAREMNLSETAFLSPRAEGYDLRWFTPGAEVDLCGHATLATAHVLWTEGLLAPQLTARFHTRSGVLTADRRGEWIELDFPSQAVAPHEPPPGLLAALGVRPQYVGKNKTDFLIEAASEQDVRALTPDFGKFKGLPIRGVIVTSRSATSGVDFISRFFAPGVGVDEDPVTGSAHCALAPHWAARLSKDEMIGYQASARGGTVRVKLAGDRVKLGGQAVTVLKGELV